jgi:hypothetical protein
MVVGTIVQASKLLWMGQITILSTGLTSGSTVTMDLNKNTAKNKGKNRRPNDFPRRGWHRYGSTIS